MTAGIVYRMSQAGYCPKKLSAIRLGLEPEAKPSWLETAGHEGKWHETRIIDELRADNIITFGEQMEVDMNLDSFHIIGHIDGKVDDGNGNIRLLEIKSMSQFEFDRWMRGGFAEFPEYAGQLTCYMAATELDTCLYIVKNRNSGYIDKQIIQGYPANLAEIVAKHWKVEEYALRDELVPAEFDPTSYQCKRCEFKSLCLPAPKQINGTDKLVLEKCIADRREAKELEARAKELKEAADDILTAYLNEQPERRFVLADAVVMLVNVKREAYEKKILVELFGKEKLLPALRITEYSYVKVDDLKKEADND